MRYNHNRYQGRWYVTTYRLIMQDNGDLVLWQSTAEEGSGVFNYDNAAWKSNTAGQGVYADFQLDGNFVLYTPDGVPLWATNTDRMIMAQKLFILGHIPSFLGLPAIPASWGLGVESRNLVWDSYSGFTGFPIRS